MGVWEWLAVEFGETVLGCAKRRGCELKSSNRSLRGALKTGLNAPNRLRTAETLKRAVFHWKTGLGMLSVFGAQIGIYWRNKSKQTANTSANGTGNTRIRFSLLYML